MAYIPTEFDETVNVTNNNPLAEFFKLIVGLVAVLTIAYLILGVIVDYAADYIDPELEGKIFPENIAKKMFAIGDVSPKLLEKQKKLQKMVDDIPREAWPKGYETLTVMIIPSGDVGNKPIADKDKDLNAFALPGGYIFVTESLVDQLKSENAITFVLGHEFGHFVNRDHLRGLGRGLIAMVLYAVLFSDGSAINVTSPITTLLQTSFSRTQESKADIWGLKALVATYGHAGGANDFFNIVKYLDEESVLTSFITTHPMTDNRINDMNTLIKENNYPIKKTLNKDW